jgi:hypothetical protein
MTKVVGSEPLAQLHDDQAEIDQMRDQLAAKIKARNRAIVAAVDDGYPQDQVAKAVGVGATAVTKILASTDPNAAA